MQEQAIRTWEEVIKLCQDTIWSDVMLKDLCERIGVMVTDETVEFEVAIRRSDHPKWLADDPEWLLE
jgi:hypothetical protein